MAAIPVSNREVTRINSAFDWEFFVALGAGWAILFAYYRRSGATLTIESALVVIMISYAVYTHFISQRYVGREDKLGDYLYYLGFLFTLSALIAALLSFQASGGFKEVLIRDFGTALFTTLVGMAGRICFYQIHPEAEVDPVLAMRQLGEEARLVGMQLHNAAGDISSSYDRIVSATEGALNRVENSFSQSFSGVSGKLNEAGQNLSEIVTQMHNLGDRLAEVEIPKDLLVEKLTPLTRSLTNNAKKIDQATITIGAGIDKLNATLSTTDVSAAQLSETILKLVAASDELKPLVELLRQICHEVDELGGRLNTSSDLLVAAAGKSLDILKELAARSAADAELVERHRKGMDDELARIRSTIGETAEALRPLASMIRERAEIEAKDATWYRAELEHQLQQIRDLHNDLQTNAASLIKFISGNLSNGA